MEGYVGRQHAFCTFASHRHCPLAFSRPSFSYSIIKKWVMTTSLPGGGPNLMVQRT